MRESRGHAQNTVAGVVKQFKPFLAWARDERGQTLSVDPAKLTVEWEDVEKCWLSADGAGQRGAGAAAGQPGAGAGCLSVLLLHGAALLGPAALHAGNVQEWDGGQVLRLTQTKTRTGVSIYLTPPALALLDKYAGTRARLLPVMANPVMNRYLKRIARLAGVDRMVEVVETIGGQVMKRPVPKWELVTMHTARHTFATQSLMRGMPVEVLQKVLGHANIQNHADLREDCGGLSAPDHAADLGGRAGGGGASVGPRWGRCARWRWHSRVMAKYSRRAVGFHRPPTALPGGRYDGSMPAAILQLGSRYGRGAGRCSVEGAGNFGLGQAGELAELAHADSRRRRACPAWCGCAAAGACRRCTGCR